MRRVAILFLLLPLALEAQTWKPLGPDGGYFDRVITDLRVPGRLLVLGSHLWMSGDDGASWTRLPISPSGHNWYIHLVNAVTDPHDPNVVWLATYDTLYRTADGGRTLTTVRTGWAISSLVVYGGAVFVTVACNVEMTNDAGASWASDAWSSPMRLYPTSGLIYAVDDGGAVYCSTNGHTFARTGSMTGDHIVAVDGDRLWSDGGTKLIRSWDRGAHWQTVFTNPNGSADRVTVDPVTRRLFWPDASGLRVSDDGGFTWEQMAGAPKGEWNSTSVSGDRMLANVDDRLLLTTNGGSSWRTVDEGLSDFGVQRIAVDPSTAGLFIAKLHSTLIRHDANGWGPRFHRTFDIGGATFDPFVPGRAVAVFKESGFNLNESLDGGVTWTRKEEVRRWVDFVTDSWFAFDRWLPSRLYFSDTYGSARVSNDGGTTWIDLDFGCGPLSDLAVTDSALYGATGCGLVRSDDRGTTWTQASPVPAECSGDDASRQDVSAVAAANGVVVISSANCRGAFFTSVDGGKSWGRRFAQPNADGYFGSYSIVADPRRTGRFFAATGLGVVRTDDGGKSWYAFNDGLDSGDMASVLAFDAVIGRLYLGTQKSGVWYADITDPSPRRRSAR